MDSGVPSPEAKDRQQRILCPLILIGSIFKTQYIHGNVDRF
jgi:hypothetical protein